MGKPESMLLEFEMMNWFPVFVNSTTTVELRAFMATDESSLERYQPTLGLWIRDHLLAENRSLYQTFLKCGVHDRDEMTMVILRAFHRQLRRTYS